MRRLDPLRASLEREVSSRRLRPKVPPATPSVQEPKHRKDQSFVADVLRGDPDARRAFGERMRVVGRILAVQNERMGRPLVDDELGEVAQQALLAVWRKLGTFEGRASLETWVYKFCHLELVSYLRKRSREPARIEDLPPENRAQERTSEASAEEEPLLLERLLKHLSPREAQVARLAHVAELSFQETADALSLSVSSVKTHYYRGLEKLRVVLETEREAQLRREEEARARAGGRRA